MPYTFSYSCRVFANLGVIDSLLLPESSIPGFGNSLLRYF
ncbi:hypothetical protein NHE_0121 [Neorickettsia helminthoeca str. Oregon]|uniref:Uncharacterized protein n=1 Tax=Neorickettsia helminthoeca str. Oregon TaxID=1286528 RepID=X5H3G5_9RICK|nr:hypothetical protein NHE_0121 [Neorickettsia helminthoeca str. Oregon]